MHLFSLLACFTLTIVFFSSCNTLPQLYQAAEDIEDDDAIHITVSRDAMQKETDIDIAVNVRNKDVKDAKK